MRRTGVIGCGWCGVRDSAGVMSKSNAIRSALRRSLSVLPSRRNPAVTRPAHRSFTATTDLGDDMTADAVAEPIAASWSSKMIAWQAHAYGSVDELVLTSNARSPAVMGSRDVLVRVKASSVNPLDVLMAGEIGERARPRHRRDPTVYVFPEGFGQVLLGTIRQARQLSMYRPVEFPLTLGRDFCGEIVAKGVKVKSDLKIGDTVMGVVPPFQQGCHAEFVSVAEGLVRKKTFTRSLFYQKRTAVFCTIFPTRSLSIVSPISTKSVVFKIL